MSSPSNARPRKERVPALPGLRPRLKSQWRQKPPRREPCRRSLLPLTSRGLVLLAGDSVLVAVEATVGEIEHVAASEVRHRIATAGVIARTDPADAVRVARVQRGAVPIP